MHQLEAGAIDHVGQDEHDRSEGIALAARARRTAPSIPSQVNLVQRRRDKVSTAPLLQSDVRPSSVRTTPIGVHQQIHEDLQRILPQAIRPQDRATLPRERVCAVAAARK